MFLNPHFPRNPFLDIFLLLMSPLSWNPEYTFSFIKQISVEHRTGSRTSEETMNKPYVVLASMADLIYSTKNNRQTNNQDLNSIFWVVGCPLHSMEIPLHFPKECHLLTIMGHLWHCWLCTLLDTSLQSSWSLLIVDSVWDSWSASCV